MNYMAIRYLVMDVDGTLTDGKIYMGNDGELMKAFDIKDGLGIHDILPIMDIAPIVITGRRSHILEKRCGEIGISKLYQGIQDKVKCLSDVIADKLDEVIYIGDDLNDLEAMNAVKRAGGLVCCPGDAVEEIKTISDYICSRNGGEGAVRECIDWLKRRII